MESRAAMRWLRLFSLQLGCRTWRGHSVLAAFLCLIGTPFLIPRSQGQSLDQVHVVPGNMATTPPSTSDQRAVASVGRSLEHLRVDVDLVLVPATVTDRMNRPVMDLDKRNFGIFEDDEPQQIRYFVAEDEPISIGLILDVSHSMTNKIDTERDAVTEFLKNANPQDDYFVISLSSHPQLIADTTESLDDIQRQLALVIPAGDTALLDAIHLGVAKMRGARYQRRALLIISDGEDNHSRYTMKETKSLVQESDVLVYSIGIFDSVPVPVFKTIDEKIGQRLLVEITEASGGRTISADKRAKVPELAGVISRELRQRYVIGYKSSNTVHDGKWRKIKLRVTGEAGEPQLRTYYKRGYIAPQK